MASKLSACALALVALFLAGCAGQAPSGPGGGVVVLPAIDRDVAVSALLPPGVAGEDLPTVLGTVRSSQFRAVVGGFTQTKRSQTLAFPVGTTLVIRNLSSTESHTFNVVAAIAGPPAKFPLNPNLSFSPSGGPLRDGYASGVIAPGKSVRIALKSKGTYLVGCAFHYGLGMRDVLVVADGAKPGTQATASPSPTPKPTATPAPTPSPKPTGTASATPTPTPTPVPTATPTPGPGNVVVKSNDIFVCTVAGTNCPSTIDVTVSQSGYSGTFTPSGCSGNATVAVNPPSSSNSFAVTAEGAYETICYVNFAGGGGKSGRLEVWVNYPGGVP